MHYIVIVYLENSFYFPFDNEYGQVNENCFIIIKILLTLPGILEDKTMGDKSLLIPNDDKKYAHYW